METHDVRLITFWHTGTRTIQKILNDNHIQVLQQHFDGNYKNRWIWEKDSKPAVVPMKDKEEVRESWNKRYMTGKAHSGQFARMWQEMEDFTASAQEVYVIHLTDPSKRDEEIRAISKAVGKPIKPDWSLRLGANGA